MAFQCRECTVGSVEADSKRVHIVELIESILRLTGSAADVA